MSIDARIDRVTYEADGTAKLHLVDRDKHSSRGVKALTVLNPAPGMEMLVGENIWGGDSQIMLGDTLVADRVSAGSIRLLSKQG